jgi:hypothetical protein
LRSACNGGRPDADTAKAEPGIVQVALDRAGAGLPCIGLSSGGIADAELQAAGASPIFADPQDLLEHLESTRIAALASSR